MLCSMNKQQVVLDYPITETLFLIKLGSVKNLTRYPVHDLIPGIPGERRN